MSGKHIGLDTIITLSGEHLRANLDDEIVLLNTRTARYHAVRGAGNEIFQLLDQPRSVRDLCEVLTARFDVSADDCQRDVLDFVRLLIREQLADAT